MAHRHGLIGKLKDILEGALAEVAGTLAPQSDAIPIPVRNDPERRR